MTEIAAEAEARLARVSGWAEERASLSRYVAHVADELADTDFEGRRRAIEALGIVVWAEGDRPFADGGSELWQIGLTVGDETHPDSSTTSRGCGPGVSARA